MDTVGEGGVRSSSRWTQSGRVSKGLEVDFNTGRTVQGQAISLDTVGDSGVRSSNASEHSRMKPGWTQSDVYRSLLEHR